MADGDLTKSGHKLNLYKLLLGSSVCLNISSGV